MARERLTDKRVSAMRAPASGGRREIHDKVRTGLSLRLTDKGSKTWSVLYRFNGKLARVTLGAYPAIGVAKARTLAGEALELVEKGTDPRDAKAASEAVEAQRAADTVDAVAKDFIAKHAAKKRWGHEMKRILDRDVVPKWKGRPLADVTRRDARALLDEIEGRAPTQRNRVLEVLRVFAKWAAERDIINADFTSGIKKNPERARERALTDDEVRAFWMAAGQLAWPFGDILKLLLLTGARKSEIGEAHWSEIHVDDKVMEIPATRTKQARAHVIPLSPAALTIIAALKKVGETPDLIFTTNAKTPVSGFSKAKLQMDLLMEVALRDAMTDEQSRAMPESALAPWVIHDLRRTVRSNLSKLGISSDVAERILGHAIPGIRGVYDRHSFVDERRDALDRWALHVAGIVSPRPDNIVPLKSKGRARK
ncbi:MAG: integrase arm-type DNA-binding domain-containing protein [Alphaproteobacteria bacterium]|nr:integrase arm-type DNA-binding domain-containing protein [Alphaproteobacteria bacterium]